LEVQWLLTFVLCDSIVMFFSSCNQSLEKCSLNAMQIKQSNVATLNLPERRKISS